MHALHFYVFLNKFSQMSTSCHWPICICLFVFGHLFSHVKDSSNNIHPIEQPREWRKALTYAQKLVWVSLKTLRVKRGLKDMGERVFVCFLLCLNLGVSARFRLTQHPYNVTSALSQSLLPWPTDNLVS